MSARGRERYSCHTLLAAWKVGQKQGKTRVGSFATPHVSNMDRTFPLSAITPTPQQGCDAGGSSDQRMDAAQSFHLRASGTVVGTCRMHTPCHVILEKWHRSVYPTRGKTAAAEQLRVERSPPSLVFDYWAAGGDRLTKGPAAPSPDILVSGKEHHTTMMDTLNPRACR